jgi:hypothetical protein
VKKFGTLILKRYGKLGKIVVRREKQKLTRKKNGRFEKKKLF